MHRDQLPVTSRARSAQLSHQLGIALVSREYPPFYGGGIGTYARWIVPALESHGIRVHVVTEAHDRTHPRVECYGNVTVHRIPIGMGKGGWPNAALRFSIQAARQVATLYRSGRIQVAEFAECEAAGIATLMCNPCRPPTVVQLHTPSEQLFVLRSLSTRSIDTPHRVYFESERLAMHLADEILAPSRFIADWAHNHYRFPTAPKVIPYATGPLPSPEDSRHSGDETVIFFAGRIEPRKGVESLILAMNEVSRAHPRATLRLAGADTSGAPEGGSMRAYLQSLIEPHAADRIHFLGRLDRDDLRHEYARASLCVVPSLWENFPNTCIESMSHARAVLVSDQGGMKEMVGNTRAGRTFSAGDPDDLAREMKLMLTESFQSLAERGRIARERIEYLCDPDRVAADRIEHFHRVVENHGSSPARNREGALGAWSGLESALTGDTDSFQPPPVSQQILRWVDRIEECAC